MALIIIVSDIVNRYIDINKRNLKLKLNKHYIKYINILESFNSILIHLDVLQGKEICQY